MSVLTANQKVIELHRQRELQGNYDKTLLLLQMLKDGEVTIDDFEIVEGGWTLVLPMPENPS